METKIKVHFLDNELMHATNPIRINVIGAGGTGSKVITALMELNLSLMALDHPGIDVHLWDNDIVEQANISRQRFAQSEIGLPKAIALINRANRWTGSNWKAHVQKFERDRLSGIPQHAQASVYLSCVDNVQSRFDIADIISNVDTGYIQRDIPKYWMDFGNTKQSGQVILSTVGNIEQPKSNKFIPVNNMPFITDQYGDLLIESQETDNTPSCSVAEALEKQDLYINSTLANMGCSLLWNLLRAGMIENRGFFVNLHNFSSQPIPVGS